MGLVFPIAEHRPPNELKARYRRIADERAQERRDHFSVVVPKSWREIEAPPAPRPSEDQPFVRHALFASTEGPECALEITTSHLRREMAPAEWLEYFLRRHGYTILETHRWPVAGGGEAMQALTRSEHGGAPILSRWGVVKDGRPRGARMFAIEARTAEASYRELATDMYVAVDSFALSNPGPWPFAENLLTYTRANPADFLMFYPESWKLSELRADDDPNGILVLNLHNDVLDAVEMGRITLLCSGSNEREELVRVYLRGLVSHGIIPEIGALSDSPVFGMMERAWMATGRARLRRGDDGTPLGVTEMPADWSRDSRIDREPSQLVRVLVGKRGSKWFLLGMVGPLAESSPFPEIPHINERAFYIVATTMQNAD